MMNRKISYVYLGVLLGVLSFFGAAVAAAEPKNVDRGYQNDNVVAANADDDGFLDQIPKKPSKTPAKVVSKVKTPNVVIKKAVPSVVTKREIYINTNQAVEATVTNNSTSNPTNKTNTPPVLPVAQPVSLSNGVVVDASGNVPQVVVYSDTKKIKVVDPAYQGFDVSIQNLLTDRQVFLSQVEQESLNMSLAFGSLREPIFLFDAWSDGYGQFDPKRLSAYLADGQSEESVRFVMNREIKALRLLKKALTEHSSTGSKSGECADSCENDEYLMAAQGISDRLERFLEIYPNNGLSLSVALNVALMARADGRWTVAKDMFERAVDLGRAFEKARKSRSGYASAMTERALLRLWQLQMEVGDESAVELSVKDIRARGVARGLPNWGFLPKELGMTCQQRAMLVLMDMSDGGLINTQSSFATILSAFDEKQPTLMAMSLRDALSKNAHFIRIDKASLLEKKMPTRMNIEVNPIPTPALAQLSSGRLLTLLSYRNGAYHLAGAFGEESWMLHRHLVREMTGVLITNVPQTALVDVKAREATSEEMESLRICQPARAVQ